MSKSFRSALSLIIAFILFVSCLPFSASAETYSVGDIIEFGGYPQSRVNDTATITALNTLSEGYTWKSYGYYSGNGGYGSMMPGNWMKYVDINYNGAKYRGVTFSSYRPYKTYSTLSTTEGYQIDNSYSINSVYWFKWEKIRWRVLDPGTGLVMSEKLIDCQAFSNTIYFKADNENYYYYSDSENTTHANDYESSSIRAWLLNDFYNTAFSLSEKDEIAITQLDNSPKSSISYYHTYTYDKVFLLSDSDVKNSSYGFSSEDSWSDTRIGQGTEYAKCQGLYVSDYKGSSWWSLRSVYSYESCSADSVRVDGYMLSSDVSTTSNGIRPAFKFKSGIVQSSNPFGVGIEGKLSVANVVGKADAEVAVDIIIDFNPGIVSMGLEVDWDPALTLVSVEDGGILGDALHVDDMTMKPYYLKWENFTAPENITATGVIATFTFRLPDDALDDDVFEVSVDYQKNATEILNFDLEEVAFVTDTGTITIRNFIIGDVNDDGEVNNLDCAILSRYCARWAGYDAQIISWRAADVDGNGTVNNLDTAILSRYLARWDGYESYFEA